MAQPLNNIPNNLGMRRGVVMEEEITDDCENEEEDTIDHNTEERLQRQMRENVADLISTIRNDTKTLPQPTNETKDKTHVSISTFKLDDASLHMAVSSNENSLDSCLNSSERECFDVSLKDESIAHGSQTRLVTYQLPRRRRESTTNQREDSQHNLDVQKVTYKLKDQHEGEVYVPSKKQRRSHSPIFRRTMNHLWRDEEAVMDAHLNDESDILNVPSTSITKDPLTPYRRESIDRWKDDEKSYGSRDRSPSFENRYERRRRYEHNIPDFQQQRDFSPPYRRHTGESWQDKSAFERRVNTSSRSPYGQHYERRNEDETLSMRYRSHSQRHKSGSSGDQWDDEDYTIDRRGDKYDHRSRPPYGHQHDEEYVGNPMIRQHRSISASHRSISPLHRSISPPHRSISPPHRSISPLHRSISPPHSHCIEHMYRKETEGEEDYFINRKRPRDPSPLYRRMGQRRSISPRLWTSERSSSESRENKGERSGYLSRNKKPSASNCGSTLDDSTEERAESDDSDVEYRTDRRLSDVGIEASEPEGSHEQLVNINYRKNGDQCDSQGRQYTEESNLSDASENQHGRWRGTRELESPDSGSVQGWSTRHDSSRNRRKSGQSLSPEMGYHRDDWPRDRNSGHSLDQWSETKEPHHSLRRDVQQHDKHPLDSPISNKRHSRSGGEVEEDERDILGLFQHAMEDLRTKCEREEDPALRRALLASWKDHERECLMFLLEPDIHPDYDKEYKIYLYQQTKNLYEAGTDPGSYDYHYGWKHYWPSRLSELFQESWKRKVCKCMSNQPSESSNQLGIGEFKNEETPHTSKIVHVLKVIDHLKNRFGDLEKSFSRILRKALALEHDKLDSNSILNEDFPLLEKIGEKLLEILSDKNLTLLQRAIIQESYERFNCILQVKREKTSVKHELDISTISRTTMGQDAHSILTFIKDSLINLGHKNVAHKKMVKIYMKVKKEQYKIKESCPTMHSSGSYGNSSTHTQQSGMNVSSSTSYYTEQMPSMLQWQRMFSSLPPPPLMNMEIYSVRPPDQMGPSYQMGPPDQMGPPYMGPPPKQMGPYSTGVPNHLFPYNLNRRAPSTSKTCRDRTLKPIAVSDAVKKGQKKQEEASADTRLDDGSIKEGSVSSANKLQKKLSPDDKVEGEEYEEEASSDTKLEGENSMELTKKIEEATSIVRQFKEAVEPPEKSTNETSTDTEIEGEGCVKPLSKMMKNGNLDNEFEISDKCSQKMQMETSPDIKLKCHGSVELPEKLQSEAFLNTKQEMERPLVLSNKTEKESLVAQIEGKENVELSSNQGEEISSDSKFAGEVCEEFPKKLQDILPDFKLEGDLSVNPQKKNEKPFVKQLGRNVDLSEKKMVEVSSDDGVPSTSEREQTLKDIGELSENTKGEPSKTKQLPPEVDKKTVSHCCHSSSINNTSSEIMKMDVKEECPIFTEKLPLLNSSLFGAKQNNISVKTAEAPFSKKAINTIMTESSKQTFLPSYTPTDYSKLGSDESEDPLKKSKKPVVKQLRPKTAIREAPKVQQLPRELYRYTIKDCLNSPSKEDTSVEMMKVDFKTLEYPMSTEKSLLLDSILFGPKESNVDSSEPETSTSTEKSKPLFSKKPIKIIIPQSSRKKNTYNCNPIVDDLELL